MDTLPAADDHVPAMDITNESDLERVVQTILDEQKSIEVLVNSSLDLQYSEPQITRHLQFYRPPSHWKDKTVPFGTKFRNG